MKVYINGQGHMTKMDVMAINSKIFLKYVDQKRQDNFSCKHGKTLKSMEFSKVRNTFVHLL